ncbi:transporter [Massilia norwichensis]|uniref:Transporter n=1 Tax=Massilia norwichensis TaxID=1442366 RepID=A0ABT2AD37_9BURK|nr:transporter [Massilia norwichensis]MCS0592048.1 transporter [Massilia norwichensis]
MKIQSLPALALALCGAFVQPLALAQESSTPATSDAVRDALAKKEGDADNTTLLKETLTAVDKQYSLIRKGQIQVNYELNYAYIGQDKINTDLSSGQATLFSIENSNSHTITNTLMADYGVLNNLTANVSMPFISRYADNVGYSGVSHTLGDLGLNVRWQPHEVKRDEPTFTITGGVRLATGESPFKVDNDKGLATGSGINTFSLGSNVTRIVDPVALFGSVNVGYGLKAKHLHQQLYGATLREVKPGASFGFGLGFAYALSYKITTSFSFQQSISARSTLTFEDGSGNLSKAHTSTQSAGILSIGLGYRFTPKTTVNVTVGAGLTASAPNLSMTMSVPLLLK